MNDARRAVGPVEVLHHQDHRVVLREGRQKREQRLEDARLGLLPGPAGVAEAGEDRIEGGAEGGRQTLEGGVAVANQWAEGREERGVGKLVVAELDAVAGEDARAGVVSVALQLVREARLADSGLTAN